MVLLLAVEPTENAELPAAVVFFLAFGVVLSFLLGIGRKVEPPLEVVLLFD